MMRWARDFRLIPIVLLASVCLLGLKVSGIIFDGGYTLGDRLRDRANPPGMTVADGNSVPDFPKITFADQAAPDAPAAKMPWAKEMFGYNDSSKGDVTGSVGAKALPAPPPPTTGAAAVAATNAAARAAASTGDITNSAGGGEKKPDANAEPPLKASDKPPAPTKLEVGGDKYPLQQGKINSPGERAILGRLQDRRQELDDRGKELEMRESLIKAAEKRLEAKVNELKEIEARIKAASGAREEAEAQRFKGIVAMYENMKPKDAARIFDRLDMRILAEVATTLKPRTMSEILAQMTPDAAEKLTVELANRANAKVMPASADELPKIDGRPRS
ncbi:MAG: flagellar protein FlbB [Pseudolabrys sp.]|nr:flagellar protein FlbB [Pseudolabrys sp.]MDP2294893.1 flagellar protein FlbB [Pseudolabrys sp.]